MHNHPRWFVDGNDVFVFIKHIERDALRLGAHGRARFHAYGYALATAQPVRTLYRAIINQHQSGLDEFLNSAAAYVAEMGRNRKIQAVSRLIIRNDEGMKK